MNKRVLYVAAFVAAVFAYGAWFPPDEDFVRFLSACSLVMSVQMVWATRKIAWRAVTSDEDGSFAFFAIGIFVVNVSLAMQRLFGFAVRDLGQSWLIVSDAFSFIVLLMIAGQSFKYAAFIANGKGVVRPRVAVWLIVRVIVIAAILDAGLTIVARTMA